jgi:hypothetical protein
VHSPDISELLEQLQDIVPHLNVTRLTLLNRMAVALQNDVDTSRNSTSDFATPRFLEYFSSRLLIHHSVVEEKLNKKSFEYVFRDALRHDGKTADLTVDETYPGADIVVDGVRISLKTEASKRIKKEEITISKFMEARWIRGQNSSGLAKLSSEHLGQHMKGYERVLILRAFTVEASNVQYDLLEIPHSLLMLASSLQASEINLSSGKSGGGRALIQSQDQDAFTVRFDGSVEKVTIAKLRSNLCTSHASWTVPLTVNQ